MTLEESSASRAALPSLSSASYPSVEEELLVVSSGQCGDDFERMFRDDYDVATLDTLDEARRLLKHREFGAVIVDSTDSDTSEQFWKLVAERQPASARLLLTGSDAVEEAVEAVESGLVDDYLRTTWRGAELRLVVRRAIDRRGEERERARLEGKIGELRQALAEARETIEQLERVKSVFSKIVSHELNTPVATALGYASLLGRELGEDVAPPVAKALDGLESSAARLKEVSRQMFKMLSEGGPAARLTTEQIDPDAFLENLHRKVAPFVDQRDQSLEIEVDDDLGELRADPAKLEDIATNLIMNAIKFSPDGESVRVSLRPEAETNRRLLVVEDDGIGIDDEDRARIFEPFFSTFDSEYHSSGQFEFGKRGLGLGLTVARRFTELHGGEIGVATEPDAGATFTVALPAEPADDET